MCVLQQGSIAVAPGGNVVCLCDGALLQAVIAAGIIRLAAGAVVGCLQVDLRAHIKIVVQHQVIGQAQVEKCVYKVIGVAEQVVDVQTLDATVLNQPGQDASGMVLLQAPAEALVLAVPEQGGPAIVSGFKS